jgi:hypothetical protein
MKAKPLFLAALVSLALPAFAHRLDEYLQAILVSFEHDQIQASMRLIPGVAVSSTIIATIDTDHDGAFSQTEQRRYAQTVLRDLSLRIDGRALSPHLVRAVFSPPADMKQGLGEIHIEFAADLPAGAAHRVLVIENHHQTPISVYLMNCLIPEESNLRVISQDRNRNQSSYRIEYLQFGLAQNPAPSRPFLTNAIANFASLPAMFRLGMRHIADGTDHLLFLVALLLPAPLLAVRSRWSAGGGVRHSLMQILRVVSAFTIGHSLTLALGAWGLVWLPERLVEVLIAFSILISAAHALRPLFPGREPMIAAFFGLIHGLAFAATLQSLGAGAWQRLASILGFNLGIETMQLLVVCAILPSLLLLRRTPAYAVFRAAGAICAACASLGWLAERLFGLNTSIDPVIAGLAQRGVWMALCLLAISVLAWLRREARATQPIHARQPLHG